MSLLTEASLIVTPNGYNVGKLYSVVPNTTLGDMDVVRATSATRVDSAGLVEIPRTNLLLQSQTFDNASWVKTDTTVTANSSTAPDGTFTADKFIPNTVATNHYILSNSFAAGINTISVYAKMDGYRYMVILTPVANTSYDLMSGVVANSAGSGFISASTQNAGNGWYRCVFTLTSVSTSNCFISGGSSSAAAFFNGAGDGTSGVLIWGAQAEIGNVATEYIPTVASIRTKFAGITQDGSVAQNIPRIDYPPLGGCPSILVEPVRTNLVLYSEEFNNTNWTKTNTTATANTTTAPDNTMTADTITGIGALGLRLVQTNTISFTTATSYSLSVFAKKGTNDFIQLIASNSVGGMYANFNLNTGVVGTLGTTTGTNPTSSMTNYGGGWYRCIMNFTTTATTSQVGSIAIVTSASAARAESNTLTTSVFLWGAQLEAGSYATSYIPTTTGTVTRNADVISKTGITTLIGQTEGTLFFDGIVNNIQNATSNILNTNKTPSTISSIALTKIKATNKIRFEQFFGNGTFDTIELLSTNSFANGIRTKVAVRYKSGDFAMYINGIQEATSESTYTNIGVKSELFLNDSVTIFAFQESVSFNSAILWKTALTDDQCILLTGASFSSYPEMANALIYTIQ